jgi:hypothetical protein
MTDFRTPPGHEPAHDRTDQVREPGPQPDPMLQTGRRSTTWVWLFAAAILAVVIGTLYGINNQEPQTATNEPAGTQASGSATTGAAPADANAPKADGGNSQAAPPNSPNNAAPQKDQSGQTNQQQAPKQ